MFCPYCGREVADGTVYCTYCGKELTAIAPAQNAETAPAEVAAVNCTNEGAAREEAKSAMIMAIVGAALAGFGIPGIVLSVIAKTKVNSWVQKHGKLRGMAIPARWISLGGLIESIYMTVFWTFYILFIFFMIVCFSGRYYF